MWSPSISDLVVDYLVNIGKIDYGIERYYSYKVN